MGQKFRDTRGFRAMKMNLDATDEAMAPNEFREVYHCHEDGSTGRLVNMRGFENVMDRPVNAGFTMPGQMKCVGTTRDVESSTIIYFLMDTSGTAHSIMQMQVETKALTWILRDEPLLNFKKRLEADVVEGLLYWTDGYFGSFLNNDFNPPRKVNIAKSVKYTTAKASSDCWRFEKIRPVAIDEDTTGTTYLSTTTAAPYAASDYIVPFALDGINRNKKVTGHCQVLEVFQSGGYYGIVTTRPWQESDSSYHDVTGHVLPYEPDMYFGIDWQVMDVVKHPPNYPPTASYTDDVTVKSNNLRGGLYQFKYRYIYDDYDKSVFSPISNTPLPTHIESTNRVSDDSSSLDNAIDVIMDSGPMEVTNIELAVRSGNSGAWTVISVIKKNGISFLSSDTASSYRFYNNEVGMSLDQADSLRPYDFVPIVAKRQEIIEKNRLIYADYFEEFDNVDIDVSLSVSQTKDSNTVASQTIYSVIEPPVGSPTIGLWGTPFGAYVPYQWIELPDNLLPLTTVQVGLYIFTEEYNGTPNPGAGNITGATLYVYSLILGQDEYISDFVQRMCNLINASVPFLNPVAWAAPGSDPTVLCINYQDIIFPTPDQYPIHVVNSAILTTYLPVSTQQGFKSGAKHFFGIDYYDRANRSGSTNTSTDSEKFIPFVTETFLSATYPNDTLVHRTGISWEISHRPPEFATHYRWMYGLSNISYYLQMNVRAGNIIEFGEHSYISFNEAIKNSQDALFNFSILGYDFKKGDRLRILGIQDGYQYKYFDYVIDKEILGATYLKYNPITQQLIENDNEFYKVDKSVEGGGSGEFITDEKGNKIYDEGTQKIVISKIDKASHGIPTEYTGVESLINVIVEIYRPRRTPADGEISVYYGIDDVLPIINPHTEQRQHGGKTRDQVYPTQSATGTFDFGDAFVKYRITDGAVFQCEAEQFSDFYDSTMPGYGGTNISNANAKFREYTASLRYGGRLLQDTRVNGLGKFIGSDYYTLPDKYGPIYKIEEVGDELKIIQKNHTSKILIGRAGVTQPNEEGTQIMSSTKDVLGTLLQTRWDFGTVHPGSFVKNGHKAYWFDFYAHAICRDPGNGIQNLTDLYGMKQFFIDRCRLFGSADNVDVVGGFDQQNEFLWWTFTDLTDSDNSFTVAFKDTGGRNEDGFVMLAQFLPDDYGESKMTMTAFKDNALWLMNSDDAPRCNFFGTQYKYWFTPVFNTQPVTVKRWLQIMLSSPKRLSAPNAGDVSVGESGNSPNGMVSLLKSGAFTPIQGKYVADFGKNMTTTSLTPTLRDLVNGEDMEGKAIRVRLEGGETEEHKVLAVEVEGVTTGV